MNAFTQAAIETQPEEICLGGLIEIDGPPVLGDAQGQPILHPVTKFGNDLTAQIVNNVLECKVPCDNPYASEIKTAYAFDMQPLPFHLRAAEMCPK